VRPEVGTLTGLGVRPCPASAPDLWTVPCTQPSGHNGPHRNNQTIWHDPPQPDLDTESIHWAGGRVYLTDDEPPL
jgi:hypothetical protein